MAMHPFSSLEDEQRRSLLKYYREQEVAGNVAIKSDDFRDGQLLVVNYTDQFNESTAPDDWDWRMEVARGCVLFKAAGCAPEIVVKAMPKFHGYKHCPEAQRHLDADGPLTIMQKFDGSCILVACFRGEVLIFTRGAWHNPQTRFARSLMSEETMAALEQMEGRTLAFELIHERDAKCEQNRGPNRLVLLYVCEATGLIIPVTELESVAQSLHINCVVCEVATGNEVMQRIEHLNSTTCLRDLREGFVVEISGKKYKVKSQTYQHLARYPVPRPNKAWLDKCFLGAKSFSDVRNGVDKMQNAPLDYGILAKSLFEQYLKCIDQEVTRLRSLHQSFQSPKELSESDSVTKADKMLLFPCVKLASDERDAWFDSEACRFKVAQSLANHTEEISQRGFPVASGLMVVCGAAGENNMLNWAKGLDCIVTLLRPSELQDRGLNIAAGFPPCGVEWLHLPISGASLQGDNDRATVKAAASALTDRLKIGKTVVVHCSAGLHRTGIVGYLALRLLGHSMASAFELLGQVRWETRAELEKIHFKSQSSAPNAEASKLITAAEELLVECGSGEGAHPTSESSV